MRKLTLLLVIAFIFISCEKSGNSETKIIAAFGDQPDIAKSHGNEIAVVFGEEKSIYYSSSSDLG
jgi:thioredoxin-related protein